MGRQRLPDAPATQHLAHPEFEPPTEPVRAVAPIRPRRPSWSALGVAMVWILALGGCGALVYVQAPSETTSCYTTDAGRWC